jgi:DNA polymerase-1
MKLLALIDGNSLLHRAFHALPPMSTREGTPTGALFGFLSMLLKVVAEEQPDGLLVAFDEHGPTFRHEMFGDYKAGRQETPDELRVQFPLLRELLKEMKIHTLSKEGLEADDILGIFSRKASAAGVHSLLVTGDRDALQLVDDNTTLLLTKKGISETLRVTPQVLFELYGVTPSGMIEVKGLMGDSSDNIPGVPGVGEKTALKLIREYGTVDQVLKHIDEISGPKLRERLREHGEQARLSLDLARIVVDPERIGDVSLSDCSFEPSQLNGGIDMLRTLELRSIINRLPQKKDEPKEAKVNKQEIAAKVLSGKEALAGILPKLRSANELSFVLADALTIATDDGEQFALPVSEQLTLLSDADSPTELFSILGPVFSAEKPKKILYDAKQWMHMLSEVGIPLRGLAFDPMIAAYLLHPSRSNYSLADICQDHGPACAATLFAVRDEMEQQLDAQGMKELHDTIELPLITVLFDMEHTGFALDSTVLKEMGIRFIGEIEALSKEIYALAGEEFNILSPKQLGAILFEKLGLPYSKKTKTGYSTDADTLEFLSALHPVAERVLEYRKLTKLKSTYIDGLLAALGQDGRVHTRFNQTVASTGRISSAEPNLQNIPVRTPLGREIRKAFVASPGNLLVGGDYSQIELRVLAHMAGDETMAEAFRLGQDIHTRTAAAVFGVPLDQVTSEQRSAAKAVNFGIVYGISDYGLSQNLGISRKQAGEYIRAYLDRYSKVRDFMQKTVEEAKKTGYAQTLFGRRRDIPELKSRNFNTRSFGERAAMNAPIQGTAADIIKLAMVALDRALKEGGFAAKLVLQIHDELIVDCPTNEVPQVERLLKEVMEGVASLSVPLVADVRSGKNWYDTK